MPVKDMLVEIFSYQIPTTEFTRCQTWPLERIHKPSFDRSFKFLVQNIVGKIIQECLLAKQTVVRSGNTRGGRTAAL